MNQGFNAKTAQSDEWETPWWLYDELNKVFSFSLDPCATKATTKHRWFYDRQDNGLVVPWVDELGAPAVAFVNPPYSRIGEWVEKGIREKAKGVQSVFLLPVRTDTDWWCGPVIREAHKIVWLRHRIRFLLDGVPMKGPRFASVLVEFCPFHDKGLEMAAFNGKPPRAAGVVRG